MRRFAVEAFMARRNGRIWSTGLAMPPDEATAKSTSSIGADR